MDHHGQIIRLKEGSQEAYIILHKNTFPEVLCRIAQSNICNYSIFLSGDLLFGYYEYLGSDYIADMKAIGDDNPTREWWRLTAPLQEPFPDRNDGEWWKELDVVFKYDDASHKRMELHRRAFILHTTDYEYDIESVRRHLTEKTNSTNDLYKILIFKYDDQFILYTETGQDDTNEMIHTLLNRKVDAASAFTEMQEVFYTDGIPEYVPLKKVLVSGCFDLLHSGHVEFLREASAFGELYVCIGSDANVHNLKGRPPVNSQEERKYMLNAVKYVHECRINKGWGLMDFLDEMEEIKPDIFVVNEDGNTPAKAELCAKAGIEYKVLKREPHEGLPARSTTSLRTECRIPYRIDIAGGWLDQPFVSQYYPGPVITISIEPTIEFNDRSGMASSTRRKAVELWKTIIPQGNHEQLAKILFSYDNPPGTREVSGSQDALGIVLPGLNKLSYNGGYWPESIESVHDEEILTWLENHLYLVSLGPRQSDYNVIESTDISHTKAQTLAVSAESCWNAIRNKDSRAFGKAFREAFEAQVSMFPHMTDSSIQKVIDIYRNNALGWKLSGAGGGGYLILVSDQKIDGTIQVKIRRNDNL